MAFIDDIADYLETEHLGTVGADIFVSYKPGSVDTGIFVLDTGGMHPDEYLPTHEPTFQIFIRASSYLAGKQKLEQVRAALHQKSNLTIGSSYAYFILAISEGGHLGRNERNMDEFSINFQARTR